MNVNGKHFYPIWKHPSDNRVIQIIDQRKLPFKFEIIDLKSAEDVYNAIIDMKVRGAPLIGVTAAYGMYLALIRHKNKVDINEYLISTANYLKSARPTAINLAYAINKQLKVLLTDSSMENRIKLALKTADEIFNLELDYSYKIGKHGLPLIQNIARGKSGSTVNVLTHCNAGWLACIDYGTATAPIYMAHDEGIHVHVWVDETRPRNQGARLTIWELQEHGVPCTLITDNAGGHLMQHGQVDLVIVGSDRTAINGDVANKIGTYLKALAAKDNNVPFYVALPSTSIDWNITDGLKQIPIEERDGREITHLEGWGKNGLQEFLISGNQCKSKNIGFDVTPARLVTGLITERGICKANKKEIVNLFKDKIKT